MAEKGQRGFNWPNLALAIIISISAFSLFHGAFAREQAKPVLAIMDNQSWNHPEKSRYLVRHFGQEPERRFHGCVDLWSNDYQLEVIDSYHEDRRIYEPGEHAYYPAGNYVVNFYRSAGPQWGYTILDRSWMINVD